MTSDRGSEIAAALSDTTALPEKKPLRTLDDVRRVGAEIIARKGFKETSIRDIAEALGITKSTIYHHVRSKDQLLFDIIQNYQTRGENMIALARNAGPDPRQSLRVFVREHVRISTADPVMATVLARELRSLKGEHYKQALDLRREYESYVRGMILDGQATGVFNKALDARLATIGVFSMVTGIHQWYRPGGPFTPDAIADTYEALVLNGLTAGATNPS